MIDESLRRTIQKRALWWLPEALRIKGEVLLQFKHPKRDKAEDLFYRSLKLAGKQKVLFEELLCAMSLGRLYHEQEVTQKARDVLNPVYGRFRGGFEARDVRLARHLLAEWGTIEER